jgi:hypothetical protein
MVPACCFWGCEIQSARYKYSGLKAGYHYIGSKKSGILKGKPDSFTYCAYRQ